MSGHRAPGTTPPVPPKPILPVAARLAGQLPPLKPHRDSRSESHTDGLVSSGAGGTSHRRKDCREAAASPSRVGVATKAASGSSTKATYDQPPVLTQDDTEAIKLASTSDYELFPSGKPMSLIEFSKGKKARDLPCLVKVAGGQRSLCDSYSFGQAQMFVVLEKKTTLVATCRDQVDGSAYVVPVHTEAFDLVPTTSLKFINEHSRPQSLGRITAEELLQCKSLPPVIAVSEEFGLSEGSEKKVPVGTLLFPKGLKKQVTDQRQVQEVLLAKSESGEMVHITPGSYGRFSVLASDVRISLQKALNHLKPPFTMRTISDCDNMYVNSVTVERVLKEDMLVGMMKATEGTTVEDVTSFSRMAELPVSLNLTVVTMVPKQQKTLERIYDYAHTGYYGVKRQPEKQRSSPADKVVMYTNPSYLAVPVDHAEEKRSVDPAMSDWPVGMVPKQQKTMERVYDYARTGYYGVAHHTERQCSTSAKEPVMHPNPSYSAVPMGKVQPSETANWRVAKQPPNPPNRSLPKTPMQLSETELCDSPPLAIARPQQVSSSVSKGMETPFVSDLPATKEEVPVSVSQEGIMSSDTNIAYLKTLQKEDILKLLDAMNLSAYKDGFAQEHIDGDTMACLSDEMLIDLGVSKSLHRLRLMKIVAGQNSAKSFMLNSPTTEQ